MDIEKIIVVSTNNNPDYYFYSPYIYKAWKSYGWSVCTMVTDDVDQTNIKSDYIITIPKMEGIRQETIAQASRLYAARFFGFANDKYLMISDMDLLPLSDYWHPRKEDITSYGHDLTDYSFYPMGYIGMTADKWKQVMQLTEDSMADFKRDADWLGTPYKEDWESWWNYDWDLLTKRLKASGLLIVSIERGRIPGSCYAVGRTDRGTGMVTPEGQMIDAHCENVNVRHEEKLPKFIKLFESVYGPL